MHIIKCKSSFFYWKRYYSLQEQSMYFERLQSFLCFSTFHFWIWKSHNWHVIPVNKESDCHIVRIRDESEKQIFKNMWLVSCHLFFLFIGWYFRLLSEAMEQTIKPLNYLKWSNLITCQPDCRLNNKDNIHNAEMDTGFPYLFLLGWWKIHEGQKPI